MDLKIQKDMDYMRSWRDLYNIEEGGGTVRLYRNHLLKEDQKSFMYFLILIFSLSHTCMLLFLSFLFFSSLVFYSMKNDLNKM